MATRLQIRVDGLAALMQTLDGLKLSLRNRVIRAATTKAGRIVSKSAKQLVAVDTGRLKRSIGVKVKAFPKRGAAVAIIGPRRGFKADVHGQTVDPVRYGHFVELGRVGATPRPFLRPAIEQNRAAIRTAMAETIASALTRLAGQGKVSGFRAFSARAIASTFAEGGEDGGA